MAPKSILVLGAGELGGSIISSLSSHSSKSDIRISVLLRSSSINSQDASKRTEMDSLRSVGVDLVEGDVVEDPVEHLANIFSRYHTIINATGMYAPAGTQTRLAQAAIASGCERYFPWQFGVDYDTIGPNSSQDLFTEQLDVRALLRGQDKMQWVIVSTGMFISFLFEPVFGIVNEFRDAVMAIGSWDNRITVTSPEDIGVATAEIALACPDVNGVVFVAGDTVSMKQIADIVDEVLGRKVDRTLKTVPQLKAELAQDPNNSMCKYRIVFAEGVGIAWDKNNTFNAHHGIRTQSVLNWAMQNLKA